MVNAVEFEVVRAEVKVCRVSSFLSVTSLSPPALVGQHRSVGRTNKGLHTHGVIPRILLHPARALRSCAEYRFIYMRQCTHETLGTSHLAVELPHQPGVCSPDRCYRRR